MTKKRLVSAITPVLAMALLLAAPITGAHSPPEDAKVYFVGLADGEVVKSPFKVKFGIEGFGITPAGTTGKRRHTAGHHHLLVDVKQLPDMDEAIPRDPLHIHFDRGETEVMLKLPSGRHTLQLLLGDEQHEPQAPPLISEKITITVN
ncbi:MAG: DUF4399 domain-containing protein [gamma proteobacterium endosymbiont of Lamellibrachia anaximandri]|nr:DUF4399 domain-containing protein [gamma proteobacterium endosymbiont of Lamellibrachia anaximandri]MBL3618777.1 DUF4399 domain-containing protein [gamma proteobacterium endosymbiont of Lamellibrachia anaximandri]